MFNQVIDEELNKKSAKIDKITNDRHNNDVRR